MDWLYSPSGFLVGLLVGMSGVGGGALMTPVLVLMFGISPALAVGTDLWFAAITKMVGSLTHHKNDGVDWQIFRRLCLGSIPASILTLVWLGASGSSRASANVILPLLAYTLLFTAAVLIFKGQIHALASNLRIDTPAQFKKLQPALTVIAGAVIGLLVTLTSVGAGAIGVVALAYLYPLRMKTSRMVGTDIAHAVPLAVVAGSGHLWMGNVDLQLLLLLLTGSIPGVVIGSFFSSKIPENFLRILIALVLSSLGMRLLLH